MVRAVIQLGGNKEVVLIEETGRNEGEWLVEELPTPTLYHGINSITYVRCSVCGKPNYKSTNFCPNCGADMRERVSEDE